MGLEFAVCMRGTMHGQPTARQRHLRYSISTFERHNMSCHMINQRVTADMLLNRLLLLCVSAAILVSGAHAVSFDLSLSLTFACFTLNYSLLCFQWMLLKTSLITRLAVWRTHACLSGSVWDGLGCCFSRRVLACKQKQNSRLNVTVQRLAESLECLMFSFLPSQQTVIRYLRWIFCVFLDLTLRGRVMTS